MAPKASRPGVRLPPEALPPHIRQQLEAAGIDPATLTAPRRLREAPADNPYEDTEQRALFARIDMICYHPAAAARWPHFRRVFAVPNGGKRDAQLGRWLKEQGVRKGIWDVWVPVQRLDPAAPNGIWSGLTIEVKRRHGTGSDTTHISRRANADAPWWSQAGWWAMLHDEWQMVECHGGAAAWETLCAYLRYPELVDAYDVLPTGITFARLL